MKENQRLKIYLEGGSSIDFDLPEGQNLQTIAKAFENNDFIVIGNKAIVSSEKVIYMTTIIEDE